MMGGQINNFRGVSFQMQRQLLCPPNHLMMPHIIFGGQYGIN